MTTAESRRTSEPAPHRGPDESLGRRAVPALAVLSSYLAVFAIFGWPWLRVAARAVPTGGPSNPADDRLVVWVLAWVAHALVTDPLAIWNAPINHPAPGQLTGSEHFATFQFVFAPLDALTGNPLLAAQLTVFATYPLAAFAMERLLRALGTHRAVAWTGGLLFALGPMRVPAHLHSLQYANVFLPWVALACTRLREVTSLRRAAGVVIAAIAAFFSSFYVAVMTAVTATVWGAAELARARSGRVEFVCAAAIAMVVAGGIFAAASIPYLARPEGQSMRADAGSPSGRWTMVLSAVAYRQTASAGRFALCLASVGAAGLVARSSVVRALAWRGLFLTVVAQFLMLGPKARFGDEFVATPLAVLAGSPIAFFRFPFRFVIVLGFGLALLSASAMEMVVRRFGRRLGVIVAAAIAVAVSATRGPALSGVDLRSADDRSARIYDVLADVARGGAAGPLLELPLVRPLNDASEPFLGSEVRSMIAGTRHWMPLVTGFTGYAPPHRPYVDRLISALPAPDALADLAEATHVRWILLHPAAEWPDRIRGRRAAIARMPGVRRIASRDGWDLLAVDRPERPDDWYGAIALGYRPGATVLGTPLAPLPEADAIAQLEGEAPAVAPPGKRVPVELSVANRGRAPWPSLAPPGETSPYAVELIGVWRTASPRGDPIPVGAPVRLPLPRDVHAGETVRAAFAIEAPAIPGEYELEIRPMQPGGARFGAPGNDAFRARVRIAAAAPQPGAPSAPR